MLNKELLMGAKQGQRKVQLTIGAFTFPTGKAYGYNRADNVGSLDALPWWSSEIEAMNFLVYYTMFKRTSFKAPNGVTVFVEGYPQSISSDSWLDGDPYSMDGEIGGVRYLTFDPPPLQDISKKVKQVFTRSQKEGVVNAWEGNAYRVGYTRKGKYHQRHGLHCTGDPRWKFSLDYTSWQDRKGQRTYRGCGISIFPRLGWKLTRACHHEHIEKYITHWLYRFPSKAPNGRLIRRYLLNLGVTSQLEVPYAA